MLGHYEHVVLCRVTRSLFVLHKQNLPCKVFSYPPEVDTIPNFTTCTSDNKHESLKATHTRDQKTRADIVTMNSALADVFLLNLPKAIHDTYEPIRMKDLNTVFLYMFDCIIKRYGKTTTEDLKANWQ